MSDADRSRIVPLATLCEAAAKSAALAQLPRVARFHLESAAHFSALAFKAARS